MKVAHINKENIETDQDWISYAKEMEKTGDLKKAGTAYKKVIAHHSTNVTAYERLMIIYRRQKEHNKELKIINAAIKTFEEKFSQKLSVYNKKVTSISKALLKATGLADKKGNSIYQPGELTKWKKRKELLMKRLAGK